MGLLRARSVLHAALEDRQLAGGAARGDREAGAEQHHLLVASYTGAGGNFLGKLGVPLQQYHSICHACTKLMLEHAEDLVRYVQANREAVEQDIMDPTHFKAYLRVLENRREELGRMFGWEEGSAGKPGTRA